MYPPLLLQTPYTVCVMRMCNTESQKRSVKGFNFKEAPLGFITVWLVVT